VVFLTPIAALVALAVVAPLAAFALLERRARRVSRALALAPPPLRSRLGVPVAIVAVAGFLGIAAAQPVISGSRTQVGRADAEVFLLFDASRSMLAKQSPGSPDRLTRAKEMALGLRSHLADIPVGIASLTDRMLPHLFPTLDAQVFVSTLRDAIGIERPPPVGSGPLATDFNSLGNIGPNNYFKPEVSKRLLVVFSDGESASFDDVVLASSFRRHRVHVLFVHVWSATEKIFLRQNRPDPAYRPDVESNRMAKRVAVAGDGSVFGEGDSAALVSAAKKVLGAGPATKLREQRTRVSLAPFVALAALLPLCFVFLRRNV
jgi:hypothetical protein